MRGSRFAEHEGMTPVLLPDIAGYRPTEVIGVGDSANVYLAQSPPGGTAGQQTVVLKVCVPAPDDGGRVAECQVLLDHPVPGMPRLLDATRLPGGEQLIVMTFCPGRPLRAWYGPEPR